MPSPPQLSITASCDSDSRNERVARKSLEGLVQSPRPPETGDGVDQPPGRMELSVPMQSAALSPPVRGPNEARQSAARAQDVAQPRSTSQPKVPLPRPGTDVHHRLVCAANSAPAAVLEIKTGPTGPQHLLRSSGNVRDEFSKREQWFSKYPGRSSASPKGFMRSAVQNGVGIQLCVQLLPWLTHQLLEFPGREGPEAWGREMTVLSTPRLAVPVH